MKHVISLWETGASWKTTCVEICDGERERERERESLWISALWPTCSGKEPKWIHNYNGDYTKVNDNFEYELHIDCFNPAIFFSNQSLDLLTNLGQLMSWFGHHWHGQDSEIYFLTTCET